MPRVPVQRDLERQIDAVVGRGARRGHRRRGWGPGRIQSLLFDARRWTPAGAARWARRHGFRADEVHETDRYVRLRQSTPTPGWPKRIKRLGRAGQEDALGIRAVVEFSPP